jgi:hypothetical protein
VHISFIPITQLVTLELLVMAYFAIDALLDIALAPVLTLIPLALRTATKVPWSHFLKVIASGVALVEALQREIRRRRRKVKRPSEIDQLEQRPFWSSIALWAALLAFIDSVVALFESFIR